ncbi:glycine cleavage system aminomethyltransferase GcvT [uncultured Microscilla sp.]|uniref:glycine cleavage system aminomethyltransferase GcvT n=1 Tax=uncultured Microscilla sp. TaxID=432653 RepID=UPI00262C6741|nr:glycine cleavage system aminomethyltransferase GcvT [uncultured Microscilla sp.]
MDLKTTDLKQTALNDIHVALGGKMVEFAGYSMPVRYTSDKEEHFAVRENVGVFDVSHMGEFLLKGEGALDLIQKVSSNDASKLYPGRVQYSCLPNEQGGIIDDLVIYMIAENEYYLVVNASNVQKDWDWISKYNTYGVEMTNLSDQTSMLAVQGPKATQALQSLTDVKLDDMKFYTFEKATFAGVPDIIISATGYTGLGGVELYIPNEHAETIWNKIFEAGKDYHIQAIGLGARDTLRLEKGYCLYGNDIDDTTSPLEAGLGWVTKFTKDFVNSEALKKQKEEGVKRKLVAFKMVDKGIPRHGYELLNTDGKNIGRVTSGSMSPSLNIGIGLGYVTKELSKPGNEIMVQVRNKQLKAEVIKLPFI